MCHAYVGNQNILSHNYCRIQENRFGSDLDCPSVTYTRLFLVFCNDDKKLEINVIGPPNEEIMNKCC